EAGTLISTVMRARGYPADDHTEAEDALSVDHAPTLARYREARAISDRAGHGGATTDDLRNAMLHYRELFHELVEVPGGERARDNGTAASPDTTPAASAVADPAATAAPAAEPPVAEAPSEPVTTDAPATPVGDAASPQRSTRG